MVQALDFANREDSNTVQGVVDDIIAEFSRYGEPIQDERLYILKNVSLSKGGEYASQRSGVKVVFGQILIELNITPDLATMIDTIDIVQLGALDSGKVEVAEDAGGIAHETSEVAVR